MPDGCAVFQSTPPVKAATQAEGCANRESLFQSTPPVKAATERISRAVGFGGISIHAAREGGDAGLFAVFRAPMGFQSTPPVKAATLPNVSAPLLMDISIHAAREGGDEAAAMANHNPRNFNPRRP